MLCYAWFANRTHTNKEFTVMNDNLSHTSWKCKYHIVFAPKYRRKNIYGALKTDIGKFLRQSYVSEYSSQHKCFPIYGVFERKKFFNDL